MSETSSAHIRKSSGESPAIRTSPWRIVAAVAVALLSALYFYWYASVDYDAEPKEPAFGGKAVERATVKGDEGKSEIEYPSVDAPARQRDAVADGSAPQGNEKPTRGSTLSGPRLTKLDLMALLPADSLVYATVDLAKLQGIEWAASILQGVTLPWLTESASALGLDLRKVTRLAAGFDIRGSARSLGVSDIVKAWKEWRRVLKRPLCVVALSRMDRHSVLSSFRKHGPLSATMILGHRVYHRDPGFALTLPRRGLLISTYRRPLATVLGLYVGRSGRSARSTTAGELTAKLRAAVKGQPVVTIASTPSSKDGGAVRVPGGGVMSDGGLAIGLTPKGLSFHWRLRLDSKKHAERFAKKARYLAREVRRLLWARRSGLARALDELDTSAAGTMVTIHATVPHSVFRYLIKKATE